MEADERRRGRSRRGLPLYGPTLRRLLVQQGWSQEELGQRLTSSAP